VPPAAFAGVTGLVSEAGAVFAAAGAAWALEALWSPCDEGCWGDVVALLVIFILLMVCAVSGNASHAFKVPHWSGYRCRSRIRLLLSVHSPWPPPLPWVDDCRGDVSVNYTNPLEDNWRRSFTTH
jgi:hypothetical protein